MSDENTKLKYNTLFLSGKKLNPEKIVGKNKLAHFNENASFSHVFEPNIKEALSGDNKLQGKWSEFFGNHNPIVLELGCGKGEYTVAMARIYPNKNFIGVDIKGARIWRGAKTIEEEKINNAAFLRTKIEFIASFFTSIEGEVQQRSSKKRKLISELKAKHIPIFMLSNQLPILQLGRELPEYTGQADKFCRPEGIHYQSRMVNKTSIIAFSDPNDLLSYPIPPGFADKYLDSRLCIDVTNININVANIVDIFGLGEVANPLEAHIGYDTDERVVALIARGIGNHDVAPVVKKRCEWTELVD